MKSLKELCNQCSDIVACEGPADFEISSVEYDSRKVRQGSLFAAVKGFSVDGHDFIDAAVQNRAAALLVSSDQGDAIAQKYPHLTIITSSDTRVALAAISSAFYDHPSRHMKVIGITGTNGKTSITYLIEAILQKIGKKTGVIGTINYRWNNTEIPAPNTTPESKDLQQILSQMRDEAVEYCIMEVSSHGLALDRVHSIEFSGAVFSNLTQDHLDFHKDMEDYYAAKKRLFSQLKDSPQKPVPVVINIDDTWGKRLYAELQSEELHAVSIGFDGTADYCVDADSVKNEIRGLSFGLKNHPVSFHLKLPGLFQLYNSLCAIALLYKLGYSLDAIKEGIEAVSAIPGRFDVITSSLNFGVVVDYAHTADALAKVIESAAGLPHNRIITVFGCGGDRDKGKRPLMAAAAEKGSDIVIVTSDNPRTEDPAAIIEDIVKGMTGTEFMVEPDREKAIAMAVNHAQKDDIVVLAGKGHEDYQILGTKKIHFDDRETALKYIRERENRES